MTYQKPPAAIEELLDAPVTPSPRSLPTASSSSSSMPQTFPTIADVAQPRLRLAGLRFNPATNGPSRTFDAVGFSLQPISGGGP